MLLRIFLTVFCVGTLVYGQTRYQTLRDLFLSGNSVNISELAGTGLIGRCFHNNQPDRARGGFLGTVEIIESEAGPLFQRQRLGWAFYYASNSEAGHFDGWTNTEAKSYVRPHSKDEWIDKIIPEEFSATLMRADFTLMTPKTGAYYYEAFWNPTKIRLKVDETLLPFRNEYRFWLKKNQEYYLLYHEHRYYSELGDGLTLKRAHGYSELCYYFKKLQMP